MQTSQQPAKGISDATAGTDAVELKVTVAEKKERAAREAFNLNPHDGERRHIFFFDTGTLALFGSGVVLRARQVKGGKDDSTVKIRPVDPQRITSKWHRHEGFKLEADGVGDRMIRSASLSIEQDGDGIKAVAHRIRHIRKLFTEKQESFLTDLSPAPIDFEQLAILGPVDALRWKVNHPALPHPITAEQWMLPDGRDLLEVSIKVPTVQAPAASAAFDAFLKGLHLRPQGGQETKTRVALEFFVKQAGV
jgi:hypothetical protein